MSTPRSVRSLSFCLAASAWFGTAASAQCNLFVQPHHGVPGVDGEVVAAATWDPDGPLGLPPHLVVGGQFAVASNLTARNIAAWNPATGSWSALGVGLDARVVAVAVGPNGDLFAAMDSPTTALARWNGSTWVPVVAGASTTVRALATLTNGDLAVGGTFTSIGGVAASNVARWNGTTWTGFGTGVVHPVLALVQAPGGDLVAAADPAGAPGLDHVMRWNGVAWSNLGAGFDSHVFALAAMPNGDIVAGGGFTSVGGVNVEHIARWDGASWSALGPGRPSLVSALAVLPNGDLVAGGDGASFAYPPTARWNGTTWSTMAASLDYSVSALTVLPGGELVAGGRFVRSGNLVASGVAKWNGATWSAVGAVPSQQQGMTGPGWWESEVYALESLPNGDLVAAGTFANAGGAAAQHVARWNGVSWSQVGSRPDGYVVALAKLPNGELIAGGGFTAFGSIPAANVARWDGTNWVAMGAGLVNWATALAVLPNGDVLAATLGQIWRWNGTAWSTFATVAGVFDLCVLANGDVVAAGSFGLINGVSVPYLARWNGAVWSMLGSGVSGLVVHVLQMPNGDLVASGNFSVAGGVAANRIARWNGAAWSPLGTGALGSAMALLPDGSLATARAGGIERWDGAAWSSISGPVDGTVRSMHMLPGGQLAVGGGFSSIGGVPSVRIALIATPCPASTTSYGTSCTGAIGDSLIATSLPWEGGTYRARNTVGLPPNWLVISVLGFAPLSVPLATLVPQGMPGCNLLASLDRLDLVVPTAGVAEVLIPVVSTPSLLGGAVYHQLVGVGFDPSGAISWFVGTNGLEVRVGRF